MPNLFLSWPAERKEDSEKKGTGRIIKSATVHPDSLTGNAERVLASLLLDGQALTKQEKEERGGATKEISQLCFCVGSLFFSVTFEPLTPLTNHKKTPLHHRGKKRRTSLMNFVAAKTTFSRTERSVLCFLPLYLF